MNVYISPPRSSAPDAGKLDASLALNADESGSGDVLSDRCHLLYKYIYMYMHL